MAESKGEIKILSMKVKESEKTGLNSLGGFVCLFVCFWLEEEFSIFGGKNLHG